jgi:hypothetical protein
MCAFPTTFVPVVPGNDCCLLQVHKKLRGTRTAGWVSHYACATGDTQRGKLRLEIELFTPGAPCDQDPGLIPDGSRLRATGWVIRREDGLADFTGRFTIVAPWGEVLFRGAIELLDRVGTHHPPFGGEACNPESHVEGWLAGLDKLPADSHRCLHLQFVARGQLSAKDDPTALEGFLNGVCIKCP